MDKKFLYIPYNPELREYARILRNNSTKAEIILWKSLKQRQLGVRFNRQVPLDHFIVDFFCFPLRLCIEVDGKIHKYQFKYDGDRQSLLEIKYGITFLRFSNENVIYHKWEVIRAIESKINELINS